MINIILLFILILGPTTLCQALDATSIQPATVSPGGTVVLTGGPFSSDTRVVLGNHELLPGNVQPGRLSVRIPADLPKGDYVIFLVEAGQSSQQAFVLHLKEKTPIIDELSPMEVDVCQTPGTSIDLQVSGKGFIKGAKILLDGASIGTASNSGTILLASLPLLEPGNHKIQVINPGGSKSIPHNLMASDQPTIDNISVGEDQVTSYQLIITGRNFDAHSQLQVDGRLIGNADRFNFHDQDSITYVDCGTLHYTRFQTTNQLQRVKFRILNRSGRQSEVYEATIR